MDTQLLLKTAMLAGEIMLRSGAETYRVEDTMHHILKTADHIEMAEVLVIMTGISATIKLENEKAVTVTKRVEERDTNLKLVVDVNEISRQYCGDDLTLEQAYEKLSTLKQFEFSRKTTNLAMMGVGVGISIFFWWIHCRYRGGHRCRTFSCCLCISGTGSEISPIYSGYFRRIWCCVCLLPSKRRSG